MVRTLNSVLITCNGLQVTDYAIARRIVDLHSRIEESIDRVYTLDEVRRYLLFARQFKPKVSLQELFFILFFFLYVCPYIKLFIFATDLQRFRRLHSGAVQEAASEGWLWGYEVGLEDHCPAAGEYDPPV